MKFYILTLGCPKNEVDSEGMIGLLEAAGHQQVSEPMAAEALIVNTCGFIGRAREESLDHLRALAGLKRRAGQTRQDGRGGKLLIAAGCLGERDKADLVRQIPSLDGVLGTLRWAEILPLLSEASRGGHPCWTGDRQMEIEAGRVANRRAVSAYVKVADGCDAKCAFCAIPAMKGPQCSRSVEAILAEARTLAEQGVKEIVLIAQDTTSYGRDRGEIDGLAHLLERIVDEIRLPWVRVMYAHPAHVTEQLLRVTAERREIVKYLDLPLQHGHPQVLRRMLRPLNGREVVVRLREAVPGVAIRSAFIVGYPGETEDEFRALLDFLEEMRFDRVGVFEYSCEEGTTASGLGPQVAPRVRRRRFERAMELQQRISLVRNRELIGRELEVLVEGECGDGAFGSVGRSYRDAPEVDGLVFLKQRLQTGMLVRVRVAEAMEYDIVADAL